MVNGDLFKTPAAKKKNIPNPSFLPRSSDSLGNSFFIYIYIFDITHLLPVHWAKRFVEWQGSRKKGRQKGQTIEFAQWKRWATWQLWLGAMNVVLSFNINAIINIYRKGLQTGITSSACARVFFTLHLFPMQVFGTFWRASKGMNTWQKDILWKRFWEVTHLLKSIISGTRQRGCYVFIYPFLIRMDQVVAQLEPASPCNLCIFFF